MNILTTKDVSAYLHINEKKIYQLVKDGEIPYTRVGGKIIFTKEIIDRWIYQNTEFSKNILAIGSDDTLFKEIINYYNKDNEHKVFLAVLGSINGLYLLKQGRATVCCAHIPDQNGEYSLSYLKRYLNETDYVVIRLYTRTQGIYLKPELADSIKTFSDIFEKEILFVTRNPGSGTRIIIDNLIQKHKISSDLCKNIIGEAQSHFGAAMKVLTGEAQASFGIKYIADTVSIKFIPIVEEPFDLIIPVYYWGSKIISNFIKLFDQTKLPAHLKNMPGYDISGIGNVIWLPDGVKNI